jgi:predicted phage tail protein
MTAGRSVTATFAARPNTKIGAASVNSKKGTATFKFNAVGAATGFQCALVSKKHKKPTFKKCRSPKTYKLLTQGNYTFEVRALNAAGIDRSPATQTFRIR